MNYMIDGHNLVPRVAGLSLDMPDDEDQLVELLKGYCQPGNHRVEVYFDGAPAGQAGMRNFGRVRAHFVSVTTSADDAIRTRLRTLGRMAKNWVVVSSDRSVQAAAHEAGARVQGSEEFAVRMQAPTSGGTEPPSKADQTLSTAEVDEWEAIFNRKRKPKNPKAD